MIEPYPEGPPEVLTIGHSTRPVEAFIGLLTMHAVKKVDVRTIPRSRHNPQFNKETLPARLATVGLGYMHAPGLGGLRHPRVDSPNTGWRNASFRGFADYMQTNEFEENHDSYAGTKRSMSSPLSEVSGKRTCLPESYTRAFCLSIHVFKW